MMRFFRVDLERHVSRTVSLRQEASVIVEAPDLEAAKAAVDRLVFDDEDEIEKYAEWEDDKPSRQASNDEAHRGPGVVRVGTASGFFGGHILNAMPEEEAS